MKLKKTAKIESEFDFWYDLTDGGYLSPKKLLYNEEDVKKVQNAIKVLKEFESLLTERLEKSYGEE